MDYELPSEFDLIVVGTGMVESIIAAAASRIGKHVLHIDSNNYYGGLWTSFNLDLINKVNETVVVDDNPNLKNVAAEEKLYQFGKNLFEIHVQSLKWHIPETDANVEKISNNATDTDMTDEPATKSEETSWSQEMLLKNSRKFNIDIAPKLHFARGDFVELLISSNIARYSEFKSVSRVLTWLNGQLETVPCSRSDVFSSTKVSVIEKRLLMKLLTSCLDGDENNFAGYENKTFYAYLKDRKLPDNIIHYVLYAIAMGTKDTSCQEGVANTKRFLGSLGRFGKTPFLYSMYGSGEITQAFCRLSAVFGGIYALNQPLNGIIFSNENRFKSLVCGNERINSDYLVMGVEKVPKELADITIDDSISRAIFITNSSIMESEKEHLTLLLFPATDEGNPCTIFELGPATGTCPKDMYVVHMFAKQNINPKEDFKHCITKLFCNPDHEGDVDATTSKRRPKVLWSLYYTVPNKFSLKWKEENCNVFVCPGPDLDIDYDGAIEEAKNIFNKMYPDVEFLPRAPDPEEIIIEGEDNNNIITEGQNLENQLLDEAAQLVQQVQIDDAGDHENVDV